MTDTNRNDIVDQHKTKLRAKTLEWMQDIGTDLTIVEYVDVVNDVLTGMVAHACQLATAEERDEPDVTTDMRPSSPVGEPS